MAKAANLPVVEADEAVRIVDKVRSHGCHAAAPSRHLLKGRQNLGVVEQVHRSNYHLKEKNKTNKTYLIDL